MDYQKSGSLIARLRRENGLTQRMLAEHIGVSDKAVSRWERGLGLPDSALWQPLSEAFGVGVETLLAGNLEVNAPVAGNLKRAKYYSCPRCGNFLLAGAEAAISCCGHRLEALEPQKADPEKRLTVEEVEDEWYITSAHPMEKDHYISFAAFVSGERVQLYKTFPEWELQLRIPKRGHGMLLWYCTRHGLFYQLL